MDLAEDLGAVVVSELEEVLRVEEVTLAVSVVAVDTREVGMEVAQAWVLALVLLAVPALAIRPSHLSPMRRTLSLTTQPLVVNVAPQSMSAT